MHLSSIISLVMPMLVSVVLLAIIITLITVIGKTKRTQSLSIEAFEVLANELKSDNAILKAELTTIREDLDSINKMMKEIE